MLEEYDNTDCKEKYTPEQMLASTVAVTDSTSALVAATSGQNQSKLATCANHTRKAIEDLLNRTKGACFESECEAHVIDEAHRSVKHVGTMTIQLLQRGILAALDEPNAENKDKMGDLSKLVASSVAALTKSARLLKGANLVDPDDPQVIAERELKLAAAMIEEAARKLAVLRPKETLSFGEDMTFDELILEAAANIMKSTQALMFAAQTAQKVLIKQGRISTDKTSKKYHDDATWSEGLVSAAKEVGGATHLLCDAAQDTVSGKVNADLNLVASSKAVSSSTQRLLFACRSKADSNSKEQCGLDEAGSAVKKATSALVKAATDAQSNKTGALQDEINTIKDKLGMEMQIQIKILQQEKELETARKEMARFRKMKYKK